ncbi:MAG TPA: enhanced serine sensitivity protein SseB C-terminal domain-containing protein [Rhizomicrobium sp.]
MAFVPQNPLEDALLRAQTEIPARETFYDLLKSEVLAVPGDCGRAAGDDGFARALPGDALNMPTMRINGRIYHPIFSSIERLKTYRDTPFFFISGHHLFESKRNAEFLLNPGSDLGKVLTRDEVAYCMDTSATRKALSSARKVYWREPKEYPQKLVEALRMLFANRGEIVSAALLEVAFSERAEPPHPLIGIEAAGDWRKTFAEISKITGTLLPDTIVDVVPLDRAKPMDELAAALLKAAPFYVRETKLH